MAAVAAFAFIAGCGEYPKDVEATTERIEQGEPLRLGIVAGTTIPPQAEALLARLTSQLGAGIERSQAPAEILIDRLDKREVDLVIGEFAKKSPIRKNASLSHSIGVPEPPSGKTPVLRFARKNGENRWILLTDRVALP